MTDGHGHVQLLAGYREDGSPSLELTPARRVGGGEFIILGTPGLANGCAAGDRVRVDESGAFQVVERGANVAVHLYASTQMDEADLLELRTSFGALAATVEWPAQRRFAVVTVPVAAGFRAIETIVNVWVGTHPGIEWNYGNVYDDDGQPLMWWD